MNCQVIKKDNKNFKRGKFTEYLLVQFPGSDGIGCDIERISFMSEASEVELVNVLDDCIEDGNFALASDILEKVETTFSRYNEYQDKLLQAVTRSDL